MNLFKNLIHSDTICDLGGTSELSNYGEYSGAPSEGQTYEYAKTILSLMTKEMHPEGKTIVAACLDSRNLVVRSTVLPVTIVNK